MSNTKTRILVSAFGIPFLLSACYLGGYFFLGLVLLIGIISFTEYAALSLNKNSKPNIPVSITAISLIILESYFQFIKSFEVLLLIIILVLFLTELFRNNGSAIHNIGASISAIFYLGFLPSTLIYLREFYGQSQFVYSNGGLLIIGILATIWVCDSAAFFLGVAFGKHKLFPRVSPNKSWEGAVAGFVFSVIAMIVFKSWFLEFLSWTDAVSIGIIAGTIGQTGDLVESLIKRDANVKDSSQIIPGHGGILDRFDSLLFTAPAVFLYLHFTHNIF